MGRKVERDVVSYIVVRGERNEGNRQKLRNQSKRVKREGSAQSLNAASRSWPQQQEQGIAARSVQSVPRESKTLQCPASSYTA